MNPEHTFRKPMNANYYEDYAANDASNVNLYHDYHDYDAFNARLYHAPAPAYAYDDDDDNDDDDDDDDDDTVAVGYDDRVGDILNVPPTHMRPNVNYAKNMYAHVNPNVNPLHHKTLAERDAYPSFETTILMNNVTYPIKFTIQENSGGGDCLFHSIHETLNRAKPAAIQGKSSHDIRVEIVNFVMKNLGKLHNQMTKQTFANALKHGVRVNGHMLHKDNYEKTMKTSSTYGTELEISAASQLYGINIYVVNKNGISFDQLYSSNGYPKPHNTYFIFNYDNVHFTSLIPN